MSSFSKRPGASEARLSVSLSDFVGVKLEDWVKRPESRHNSEFMRLRSAEIRSAIGDLARYIGRGKDEFVSDKTLSDAAKYRLIVAIDAAISICNHIVSRHSTKAPETYSQCFEILGDLKIIAKGLSKKLAAMARFRNLLVHLYWQVDNEKVYDFINNDIVDLEAYLVHIGSYIKEDL